MTAQIAERLMYEGCEVQMCSEPLEDYFDRARLDPKFAIRSTALRRGYVGSWEIRDGRLFLTNLSGTLADGSDLSVKTFFPDKVGPVFAAWFSGTVRIPRGEIIRYVHMGYETTWERDLMITFENGVAGLRTERHNAAALHSGNSGGRAVLAMTRFPARERRSGADGSAAPGEVPPGRRPDHSV